MGCIPSLHRAVERNSPWRKGELAAWGACSFPCAFTGDTEDSQHDWREEQRKSFLVVCSASHWLSLVGISREIDRKLPQGLHQVYVHILSLRVCQDLGRAGKILKNWMLRIYNKVLQIRGAWTQNTLPTRYWLGILLDGELAKSKVPLQSWQKTKPKQQLGLYEWWLLYL